jgi:hypothetical protein
MLVQTKPLRQLIDILDQTILMFPEGPKQKELEREVEILRFELFVIECKLMEGDLQ